MQILSYAILKPDENWIITDLLFNRLIIYSSLIHRRRQNIEIWKYFTAILFKK